MDENENVNAENLPIEEEYYDISGEQFVIEQKMRGNMTPEELREAIEKHIKWINDEPGGERWISPWNADLRGAYLSLANLSEADLRGVDLREADLSESNLSEADLSGADLRGADLRGAYLSWADLRGADLSGANLRGADLRGADLLGANLRGADLRLANLRESNLRGADLSEADLYGVNLRGADLREADLSGAKNLLNPAKWLAENFERDELGYIVYKAIGDTRYIPPEEWEIEAGKFIEEVPNPLPTVECGCGVNFGTLGWVRENHPRGTIWRCRIHWIDLPGVVVPYNTNGKARCSRLELLEIVCPA